ncbi:MAG: carboxymuconolactone decarboxylase family protein [Chlorobaculum sp.]
MLIPVLRPIEQFIFRHLTPLSIRWLPAPEIARASGLAAQVYLQLDEEFMAVPPITLHHLNPQLMAGVWSACRESLVAGPDRAMKELIAVAVSQANRCPYCVQAHTSMLLGADDRLALDALAAGGRTNDALGNLAAWASATGRKASLYAGLQPFTKRQAPAFMATAVLFHYINRMVNIFLDETMVPVVGKVPVAGDQVFRVFSRVTSGRIVRISAEPGVFLTGTPAMKRLEVFGWAADDPAVAGGLLRFADVVRAAADASVDSGVQALVKRQVSAWEGEPPGLGKGWLDVAVNELPERLRPQARLVLLAAMASWAVDSGEIESCRRAGLDDRALLETAAWGAFLAAERIAGWLDHAFADDQNL